MDAITKLHGILYVMYQVEKDLTSLQNVYPDAKGNLDHSNIMAGDIITNIEAHLKHIKKGVE